MPTCNLTASATTLTATGRSANLFDVKLRAIENMHEAGIEIVLVVTIVNNVNNDQVGTIVKFAMENPKKIAFRELPAGFVHRSRRRHHSRAPPAAALHAFASGEGCQQPGGQSRADARLVSRFRSSARLPDSRTWSRGQESNWGLTLLRLPPELRAWARR